MKGLLTNSFVVLVGMLSSFSISPAVYGDTFLGTEEDTANAPSDEEHSGTSGGGNISISGGIAVGAGGNYSFSPIIGYDFTRYLGTELLLDYTRRDEDDAVRTSYGFELNLTFRLPNPTIITPFAGFGPGYNRWHQEYKGEEFDSSGSAIVSAFAGARLGLTQNFGVYFSRRLAYYLADPPLSFYDRKTREPHQNIANSFGFYVAF